MENFYSWAFLGLRVVLVGTLFSFLGLAFLRLLRSLRRDERTITARYKPVIRLRMDDGYQKADFEFVANHFYIGRDPICEYVINHETVSSRHTIISYHHNQWWIEDAGSRNGTFLNDLTVEQQTVLTDNDSVRCGNVTFTLFIVY
ncbi:MAG: FHA domain-containing protein [Chloroflexi bacterium]|nr:FHA domain-containing protein [Chloroflexota bacterium]